MAILSRAISILKNRVRLLHMRKKGTLVYVGLHRGSSFHALFRRYQVSYGFEANPELCAELKKRYKKLPSVHIIHAAVTDRDGEIDFHISNNDGTSSSVGTFKEDWENYRSGQVRMVKTIRIPSINLLRFLEEEKVSYIDTYVSDIQGLDLTVLKTLGPFIETQRIAEIFCEVTKDEHSNIYKDLPDNSERGFNQLLSSRYDCVAKGWGITEDGDFRGVPEGWWEMDCKWKAKGRK